MTLTDAVKQEVAAIEWRGYMPVRGINRGFHNRTDIAAATSEVAKGSAVMIADSAAYRYVGEDSTRHLVERGKQRNAECRRSVIPVSIAMKNRIVIAVLLMLATACGGTDPYAEKFHTQIAIGDSRSHALEVMGPTRSLSSFEVPLVRVEQLVWKAPNGRVYVIHTVINKVISKSTIQ